MMSQVELWEMQDECSRRNEMSSRRHEQKSYSLAGIIIVVLGTVLAALSAALTIYVLKMSVAMTGPGFLITGIAGTVLGVTIVCTSRR